MELNKKPEKNFLKYMAIEMFTSRSRTFQQPIAQPFTSVQEAKELKYFLGSCKLANNCAQDEEENKKIRIFNRGL